MTQPNETPPAEQGRIRSPVEWVESMTGKTCSPLGGTVATMLEDWLLGLHHLPHTWQKYTDFTDDCYIRLVLGRTLATFDFDELTRLVFLAHDACVRVEVSSLGPRYLEIGFSRRAGREGSIYDRHPSIEMALASWRQRHPAPEGGAP